MSAGHVVDVDVVALFLALAEDAQAAVAGQRAGEGIGPIGAVGIARAVNAGHPQREERKAGRAGREVHHPLRRVLPQRVVAAGLTGVDSVTGLTSKP